MLSERRRAGFTLIELLVVMAIISLLISLVAPRYFHSVSKAEEAVLRENLLLVREALDRYKADVGVYPDALQDLVSKRYLRKLPYDPIARSDKKWITVPPPQTAEGRVYDIKSGAPGKSLNGTPYSSW
jgi:general secretion pathway protein G